MTGAQADLMRQVMGAIEGADGHWDQTQWRQVLRDEDDVDPDIARTGQFGLTADDAACGTAMCFAGWAVHLAPRERVRYLVTPAMVVAARRSGDANLLALLDYYSTKVLSDQGVLAGQLSDLLAQLIDRDASSDDQHSRLVGVLVAEHGERLDWHVTNVREAARALLGLAPRDLFDLFSSEHQVEDLRSIVDAHTGAAQ